MRTLLLASAGVFALLLTQPGFAQTTDTQQAPRAVGQEPAAPANLSAPTNPTVPPDIQGAPIAPSQQTLPGQQAMPEQRGDLSPAQPMLMAQNDQGQMGTTQPGQSGQPMSGQMNSPPANGSMGTQAEAQPGSPPVSALQPKPMPDSARYSEGYSAAGHEPLSYSASNIVPSDTRSVIAPQLPVPSVGPNATPSQLLHAARQALDHNQTGAAQEALERAETRLLDRSTEPGNANEPDTRAAIQLITQALDALGHRNMVTAHQDIDQALQRPAVQNYASE